MKNKLFKNYFITSNYNLILYIENNNTYIYSISSARKFNESNKFFMLVYNNELVKNLSLFYYYKNKYLHWFFNFHEKLIEYKKMKYIKDVFYNSKGKIKIIGRGWKVIKYSYQLLIKLGYSHMIFFNLSPIIKYKLKKKKKKYYLFYGIFHNLLNSILNKFRLMRIPDTYTRKGIFHRRVLL